MHSPRQTNYRVDMSHVLAGVSEGAHDDATQSRHPSIDSGQRLVGISDLANGT